MCLYLRNNEGRLGQRRAGTCHTLVDGERATPRARGALKRTVLHERVRNGSVGNWVALGANFSTPLLSVGVIPTMSGESRRTGCIGKWPIRPASVTRPIAGTQNPSLAAGGVFYRVLRNLREPTGRVDEGGNR